MMIWNQNTHNLHLLGAQAGVEVRAAGAGRQEGVLQ